jgi:hypothetical protein
VSAIRKVLWAVAAVAVPLAEGATLAAEPPPIGQLVAARIKTVRAWRDPRKQAVGAEILALAGAGGPRDWAATAIALADAAAAAGPLDFVTVDLQDANLADIALPADYRRLAIVYFGRTPPKSPWEDDPFAAYPASKRTSRDDAGRIAEYERARTQLLGRTRNADEVNREAALAVARASGQPSWTPPPGNDIGAKPLHRREDLKVQGTVAPATLAELHQCLRSAAGQDTWGCDR